jgi:prephenate dehydratase
MTTTVAYQGLPGAFGEEAIIGYFGPAAVTPVPMPTFSAVCHAVESGEVGAGVLPLENSVAGTVGDALDALADGALRVIGELVLPVRHHLLALPGVQLDQVERVTSHWQALAQCERFLAMGRWTVLPAADTAGAARDLAEEGDRTTAAIASERAADPTGASSEGDDVHEAGGEKPGEGRQHQRGDEW